MGHSDVLPHSKFDTQISQDKRANHVFHRGLCKPNIPIHCIPPEQQVLWRHGITDNILETYLQFIFQNPIQTVKSKGKAPSWCARIMHPSRVAPMIYFVTFEIDILKLLDYRFISWKHNAHVGWLSLQGSFFIFVTCHLQCVSAIYPYIPNCSPLSWPLDHFTFKCKVHNPASNLHIRRKEPGHLFKAVIIAILAHGLRQLKVIVLFHFTQSEEDFSYDQCWYKPHHICSKKFSTLNGKLLAHRS